MGKVENFELGAILTITTGFNCTDDFDKVWRLVWFVCNDNMIGPMGLGVVKDKVKSHLLEIHPELESVKYQYGEDIKNFVLQQEKIFGKLLPVTKAGVKLPKEYSIKALLSKEQIDKIKASHIFEQWLNGLVDENDLTIEEKNIICAYQIYYELFLNDDLLYLLLGHYSASLERFVSDLELIKIISNKLDVPQDVLKTKALLMLKREAKEKALEQPSVKKLTRKENK